MLYEESMNPSDEMNAVTRIVVDSHDATYYELWVTPKWRSTKLGFRFGPNSDIEAQHASDRFEPDDDITMNATLQSYQPKLIRGMVTVCLLLIRFSAFDNSLRVSDL